MSFVYVGQSLVFRKQFSGTVTGTPTAQVYVNGSANGSPVNGSGSGATWTFTMTVPTSSIGDSIMMEASGVVSAVTQYIELVQAAVVEILPIGDAIQFVSPMTDAGVLSALVIGDDYMEDTGRELSFRILEPELDIGDVTSYLTLSLAGTTVVQVEGTVAAITVSSVDYWDVVFELERADTLLLTEQTYCYSVMLVQGTPARYTTVQVGSVEAIRSQYDETV
jgi:hypothetical protein